jgi:hydrogenase expression/formation protein HypE
LTLTDTCPLPYSDYERVVLDHGSGGRLSQALLEGLILPELGIDADAPLEDVAVLESLHGRPAFTTDSFVARPLLFPGGDIGSLAVFNTVNDLAVCGARPLYLSLAFVLEEGLRLELLAHVARSVRVAAVRAGVRIVTGDTKVVERGKADQLFITTSGLGVLPKNRSLSIANARPGDSVLVSGTIGDHGIALMAAREGIELDGELVSDSAPIFGLTSVMFEAEPQIRCLRDPTRGGISSTLNEIARASQVGIRLDERAVPIRSAVRGACEVLGLDPHYAASEGRVIAIVPKESADRVLRAMRAHELGRSAAIIGEVVSQHAGIVVERSWIGGERELGLASGEQLPRIC